MDQTTLEGMPEPAMLRLHASDGHVLVTCGRSLLYRYDAGDSGMRNLAIVALTDAGRRVDEVAAVFGLTATYVSILRGRARVDGSAALVRRRGRPPKLSERQVAQARTWAGAGPQPAEHRRAARGGPVGDQRAARPPRPAAGASQRCPNPNPNPHSPPRPPPRTRSRPPPSRPRPSRRDRAGRRRAGGRSHGHVSGRHRHVRVSVRRGDAAASLPGPGRRAGDLRHR